MTQPLIKNENLEQEKLGSDPEGPLRPLSLDEFIGQKPLIENLRVFIQAARKRQDAMDHVLLFGPPGLGKTTLAQIIARELGVGFRATSGPVIARAGDLAAIVTNLERNDVLFIDEIHRLNPAVEEILYPAMEDRKLDLVIGEGPGARSVQIELQPFTLIGATTRSGLLTNPLRDRFGIPMRLEFYTPSELTLIVQRSARLLAMNLSADGAAEIACRARGTPRIAGRLTRRIRDFAIASPPLNPPRLRGGISERSEEQGGSAITREMVDLALKRLDVDGAGLDTMDRRYLSCIAENYGGGPVGVETLAAALSEQRDMIEDVIEPYMLQQGLIQRTPRGRVLSVKGFEHLGLKPTATISQSGFFEDDQ